MVKAGFSGEESPRCTFPAVVGRPKYAKTMETSSKEVYIGEEASQKRGILDLKYPIAAGIVETWEDMESVWNHTFYNELRVKPSECKGVLLTESINKNFTSSAEMEIVKNIKEELCFVASKYDEELQQAKQSSETDKQYTLPDKTVIDIKGDVRMKCPELLFKPELNGKTCKSMHALAW
jgi:actin-related protein